MAKPNFNQERRTFLKYLLIIVQAGMLTACKVITTPAAEPTATSTPPEPSPTPEPTRMVDELALVDILDRPMIEQLILETPELQRLTDEINAAIALSPEWQEKTIDDFDISAISFKPDENHKDLEMLVMGTTEGQTWVIARFAGDRFEAIRKPMVAQTNPDGIIELKVDDLTLFKSNPEGGTYVTRMDNSTIFAEQVTIRQEAIGGKKVQADMAFVPLDSSLGIVSTRFTDSIMSGYGQDGTLLATYDFKERKWIEAIPELPEWATEYTAQHQAIYEKDGDKQYYVCDKQVEVNGEVRDIHVRLVEFDPKTKEWIPCYETIAELFASRQLMTLMKLNQISKPEEAVWMIREGETFETEQSDLKRLEAITKQFVDEIVASVAPDILPRYSCYPIQQERFSGMVISVRKNFLKDFPPDQSMIDGVNISCPHGYIILRRGQQDQLVVGVPSRNSESTIWFGYDQSVLTAALPDMGRFADPDTITVSNLVRYCQLIDNVRGVVSGISYVEPNGLAKNEVAKLFGQEGLDPDYAKKLLNAALAFETDLSSYTIGHIFWLLGIEKS